MKTTIANTLELTESSYLGDSPEHPGLSIVVWRENIYYGKEDSFCKKGDFYYKEGEEWWRIHKSLFKHPFYNYVIAHFIYDANTGSYTLEFIDDRPLELDNEQWLQFKELIKEGFKKLNSYD